MHKHIDVIREMLGAGECIQSTYTSMSSSSSNTSHIIAWTHDEKKTINNNNSFKKCRRQFAMVVTMAVTVNTHSFA